MDLRSRDNASWCAKVAADTVEEARVGVDLRHVPNHDLKNINISLELALNPNLELALMENIGSLRNVSNSSDMFSKVKG